MRQVVAGAALLAAGCMVSVVQAAAPVRGYDPVKDDGIQTLPLYMVALQETVRPQYGYLGLSPELVTQSFIINPVPGISPAAGIVGGALGGALANAMVRAEAMAIARENWQWANNGQCRIDTRDPLEPALVQALQQVGMPAPRQHVVLEGGKLEDHFDPTLAHQLISHSSSLTPDMTALLTTVRVEGWSDKARSRHQADWVNVLQVLSTPMWLDGKQAHDTDYLKQQLDHWYAGTGNAATFVDNDCDANNSTIRLTWANARALGLVPDSDKRSDGNISFSSAFAWDFNPNDGVTAGTFDFIGVAAHEIGHALGFISGVDVLDLNRSGNFSDALFTYISPTDVFRCSPESKAAGADIDWAADNRTKYFSLDNCTTTLSVFSEGRTYGDGQQASHWKDNRDIGILDPTAGRGELLAISQMDLMMFDAIGWDVPEPASIALFSLGAAALAGSRRRKQKQA